MCSAACVRRCETIPRMFQSHAFDCGCCLGRYSSLLAIRYLAYHGLPYLPNVVCLGCISNKYAEYMPCKRVLKAAMDIQMLLRTRFAHLHMLAAPCVDCPAAAAGAWWETKRHISNKRAPSSSFCIAVSTTALFPPNRIPRCSALSVRSLFGFCFLPAASL